MTPQVQAGTAKPSSNGPTNPLDAWSADVLDSLDGGVLVIDPGLKILHRNSTAREWLGEGETVEELFAKAHFLEPVDDWLLLILDVSKSGVQKKIECALDPVQGEPTRVLSLSLTPLRHQGEGPNSGVVVTIRDSTQRFGLEERLAVSERLASIGKLAAQVAHELNNPLDGILRYVNLALRVSDKGDAEKIKSYLGESRTGLMRMVRIISELLEFSRSSRDQFDLVSVNELIEQAIDQLSVAAEANRVIVSVNYKQADMPAVRGERLYQVCVNLIKNAIDAMPDGGRIAITTGVISENVIIRFADTGPGLPDETSKVFEPFYTTKKAGKGTGLGLAICKDFIEGMGGTLDASNDEEGGAVFTVRLPVSSCQRVESPFLHHTLEGEQRQ